MSPYEVIPVEKWLEKTKQLVDKHPLSNIIVNLCRKSLFIGKCS